MTDRSEAQPRFCPGCGLAESLHGPLCPDCGATVLDQGYCTVCESYWPAPAGAECPKHEIALLAGPPKPPTLFPDGEVPNWVTIATYTHPNEAEAVRIRMEAEGIPTFLEGERMGSNSLYNVATGGVKLQVPEPLVADARVLLNQSWAPVVDEDDDLDDAWEDLGPVPGSSVVTFALWVIMGVGVLIAFLVILAIVASRT